MGNNNVQMLGSGQDRNRLGPGVTAMPMSYQMMPMLAPVTIPGDFMGFQTRTMATSGFAPDSKLSSAAYGNKSALVFHNNPNSGNRAGMGMGMGMNSMMLGNNVVQPVGSPLVTQQPTMNLGLEDQFMTMSIAGNQAQQAPTPTSMDFLRYQQQFMATQQQQQQQQQTGQQPQLTLQLNPQQQLAQFQQQQAQQLVSQQQMPQMQLQMQAGQMPPQLQLQQPQMQMAGPPLQLQPMYGNNTVMGMQLATTNNTTTNSNTMNANTNNNNPNNHRFQFR